ncbi:MAG: Gfo/Idh/MocA family oxidoreductase [Verrucomicrobiota bacterium]
MNSKPLHVGIIGCGKISNAYFDGLSLFPDLVKVIACADLESERASAKAHEKNIPKSLTVDSLLQDPKIDLVVNLTVPLVHASVNTAALEAGKHVYCEKPFSISTEEGKKVADFAVKKNLRVGTAPDTFLGSGLQTCRWLIDQGKIGQPIAGTAFMVCHGHEHWHPSPEFYYLKGGGPLFDMGPYYITALIHLMGPIKRVSASVKSSFSTRTITSEPQTGKVILVETPTHYSGTLDFENGALITIIMSFDVWSHHLPRLEIYGTEGSLSCPDPNCFHEENAIQIKHSGDLEWKTIPLHHPHRVGRGMGVVDMAHAIRHDQPHRCNGDLGLHVVEVMQAFEESSRLGKHIEIKSTCLQPQALQPELKTMFS